MTLQELILINSDKVRRNSDLMAFYIESFVSSFGYKPTCTGCSFSSDWAKLVRFVNTGEKPIFNNKNIKIMSTFKLKKTTNTILAYKLNGRTHRKYDNVMTEEFAIAYLTNGSEKEIVERKKLFAVLPDAFKSQKELKDAEVVAETKRIKSKKRK